ncbi:MAG: ribbon-helix-helix domain-containing protein [Alphaproteobacteria bacterium]|nr:ribbon-helix-helix domain-containing protein [Alphaproteobacteria bacterium]MDE2336725.1 ribbon-helix-helix domain-containing protein [Alphaproteobacteria bacterium]
MTEEIKQSEPSDGQTDKGNGQPRASSGSTLQSKNIRIHKHRTSVRLEPEMWSALNEIAALEGCSIHDLCGAVHDLKGPGASFTAALRVFMMEYYRTAARSNPHVQQVQKLAKVPLKSDRDKKKLTGV